MPPVDPAQQLKSAPLEGLVYELLQQFNKPSLLGQRGVQLTKAKADDFALRVAKGDPLPDFVGALQAALADIIAESEQVLQTRFQMTFAQSLPVTDMGEIGGWESTSEFLEVANQKSNAELRISAAATLLVMFGALQFVQHLWTVIAVDGGLNDVDAMLAKRALAHATGIDLDTPNWQATVQDAIGG